MIMIQNIFGMPEAYAKVQGNVEKSEIRGEVYFYGVHNGTLIVAEIYGLPNIKEKENGNFYGFHIHEGESCTGDLPPLLANDGIAWNAVYTERFYPEDIIGRTVVIHDMADDFYTQPSGNSGKKIACGEIVD